MRLVGDNSITEESHIAKDGLMQTAKIVATSLFLLIVIAGCRVTTPQPNLRTGACWYPPTFPLLRGTYQQQLQIQTPTPSVHDLEYHCAPASSNPIVYVSGAPDHYHGVPVSSAEASDAAHESEDSASETESDSE